MTVGTRPQGIAVVYKADPARSEIWRKVFQTHAPEISFRAWPAVGTAGDVRYLVAWLPPADTATRFPNLEVVFSTGAGADQLDLAAIPDHVRIVRMVDPDLTRGMVEYAIFGALALHRDVPLYLADQRRGQWNALPIRRAEERTVGIMGLGVMGSAIARALLPFGFRLRGWSASHKDIAGVRTFAGPEQLSVFLAECQVLICVLPLTGETKGILCASTFGALPRGARLLNIGRGGHLVEADLIGTLESGQIDCAILDVLNEEPPAADHPLMAHPRVMVTPHIASTTNPETAARRVADLIARHRAGQELGDVMDRQRGY